MKTHLLTAAMLAASLSLAAGAQASSFVIAYPSSSTSYDSATNGSGIIPAGGESAFMWTSGDNIRQTFTGTGLASVQRFSDSFEIQNFTNTVNETVDVAINGSTVGSFTVNDCGACGTDQTINFSSTFAPLTGSGTYTITMTLQDSLGLGSGSIAFLDGGRGFLSSGVPEPTAWALMLLGVGGLGGVLRRRRVGARLTA